jgi:PHD/YefM family antitoxin component YafN of YafNO toxin-antitoxin module
MQEIYAPTSAQKNLYNIFKQVATEHKPVIINQKDSDLNSVIVNKADWDAIQENLYLATTGILDIVTKREADDSGFTKVCDIDWDQL